MREINDDTISEATQLFTRYTGADVVYADCVDYLSKVENLSKIGNEEVIKIIDFLVEWKCRGLVSSRSENRKKMSVQVKDIKETLKSLNNEFKKLQGYTLRDIPLENEDIKNTILTIYEKVDSIKWIGATAASKIMHVINPHLFMMWDNDIRSKGKGYGYEGGSSNQYMEFMEKMKGIAIRLKTDPEKEIEIKIIKKRTLAKLIDEANYMGITKELLK